MTEAEWVAFLESVPGWHFEQLSARRSRLFHVALCRHFDWLLKCAGVPQALEVIEQFADTGKTKVALKRTRDAIRLQRTALTEQDVSWRTKLSRGLLMVHVTAADSDRTDVFVRAVELIEKKRPPRRAFQQLAPVVADILGIPFRPVAFTPNWRSETAVALATGIYEDRAFDRLPILADALEEAGCDHADVLAHCRGPGPHARGCWVVDGVLGKS
jgi:hypothetical protein